jgi:hypothetical protein
MHSFEVHRGHTRASPAINSIIFVESEEEEEEEGEEEEGERKI